MSIIHGVISGLAVLIWGATVIGNGHPTFLPLIGIAGSAIAVGIDVCRIAISCYLATRR